MVFFSIIIIIIINAQHSIGPFSWVVTARHLTGQLKLCSWSICIIHNIIKGPSLNYKCNNQETYIFLTLISNIEPNKLIKDVCACL